MDKRFDEALAENIEKITDSAVFVSLWHPSMADFKKEPWPAIQLAIAILQDKPIILAVPEGREPPEHLRRVADVIVYGGPEEVAAAIQRFIEEGEADV